jgi:outer membrane biosynthesis protein TonB
MSTQVPEEELGAGAGVVAGTAAVRLAAAAFALTAIEPGAIAALAATSATAPTDRSTPAETPVVATGDGVDPPGPVPEPPLPDPPDPVPEPLPLPEEPPEPEVVPGVVPVLDEPEPPEPEPDLEPVLEPEPEVRASSPVAGEDAVLVDPAWAMSGGLALPSAGREPVAWDGPRRMCTDTEASRNKAISDARPNIGTMLPAGCNRTMAARLRADTRARSATRANPSCSDGSGGFWPRRAA